MRGNLPHVTNRARVLRSSNTNAEARFWYRLRNRQLGGFKFVRQAAIGAYYADFLCREARLIVEVDSQHADNPADRQRDHEFAALGYRIIRVWNNDVSERLESVLELLLSELTAAPLPTSGERANK